MKKYNSFIKVCNSLFSYKLSSSAFVVYLYLSDISRRTGNVKVRYETIADRCNISPKTVFKAIRKLVECELIEKKTGLMKTTFLQQIYILSGSLMVVFQSLTDVFFISD